jgi:hypothetical protein
LRAPEEHRRLQVACIGLSGECHLQIGVHNQIQEKLRQAPPNERFVAHQHRPEFRVPPSVQGRTGEQLHQYPARLLLQFAAIACEELYRQCLGVFR